MRILHATSELYPYSKTGGLADMVGGLTKALAALGHEVGIVTPLYKGIREAFPEIRKTKDKLQVTLGTERITGEIWTHKPTDGITVYFVGQDEFFNRDGIYQVDGKVFPDNERRFFFLSKCVVDMAKHMLWQPEIVHVHEWQLGIVPPLMHYRRTAQGWKNAPATCLTIHNLNYQGVFSYEAFGLTNLPPSYFHVDGVEYYGGLNCLKAGIVYADFVTTVSPTYAREITTRKYGANLEGVLQRRNGRLSGILNGVDYEEWNTDHNPHLAHAYSAADVQGKARCKLDLQKQLGLEQNPKTPVFGVVSRLEAYQKGIDTLLEAIKATIDADYQFVLLGSGEPDFQESFTALAEQYPGKVAVKIGYDHGLAHRIEAGCDFFLMPSRYEPCGLNQMYSLRYGTLPIVHATGGLDDSIVDFEASPENANGLKFGEHSTVELCKAIRKALIYFENPNLMGRLQQNAMTADYSWGKSALAYAEVYQKLLQSRQVLTH